MTEELTPRRSFGKAEPNEDLEQHLDRSYKKTTSMLSLDLRLNNAESMREWNSEEEGKINLA